MTLQNITLPTLPTLQTLPLKLKHEVDTSSIFSYATCAVAVQYWVLRPQEKDNT